MRILISPDKFKGSLTAHEAANAIERGLKQVWPDAVTRKLPIADGGEGTAGVIASALGGKWITLRTHDPLGREIDARYAWLPGDTAVIEMSAASGLWRIGEKERNPLRASTFGTGELLRDAIQRGASRIVVGLGGSATNDAGAGMAAALGFAFLTSDGEPVDPVPENFFALTRIVVPEQLELPEMIAACDVTNPLLGARGASRTYGPQKGADEKMVAILEQSLEHLADLVADELGVDFRDEPGAGAAGGSGFGLLSFCGASIRPGFQIVAEILKLDAAMSEADLVITGEGRLDAQTLQGKAPAGVAALAREHHKPVIAFCGAVRDEPRLAKHFDAICPIANCAMPIEKALADAAALLEQRAAQTARSFAAGEFFTAPNKAR